ncbi:MAG: tRNA guanosine(34) transglycosylase Tgt [Acidimicrobiia bacterium]|nr:MAG: tRNA guanosine(34) transglycosylase Tgt [Acidimicrobiia bacterium]
MSDPVSFRQTHSDGDARTGILTTPHGEVQTPNFMAVGTRASVKTIDAEDLDVLGAQIVLSNTYHLMLRPGEDLVERLGGLHGFMAWDKPILTDSGGYQVLSLNPKITDEMLVFASTYDGSRIELTPERSVAVQEALGADIAMVLDVPVALPAPRSVAEGAMYQTLRWAERSKNATTRPDRALFGIVQGGADPELRRISARETAAIGFPGFGIGGLAVGETPVERAVAIAATVLELPESATRYVMGLGDTEGLLDAVALGIDLFDCVLPTRLARHGKALTRSGDISIKASEWKTDDRPLEEGCSCTACRRYTRAYIRHLHRTNEPTADRLLTLHNLAYTYRLMADVRHHIAAGSFDAFREDVIHRRRQGVGTSAH